MFWHRWIGCFVFGGLTQIPLPLSIIAVLTLYCDKCKEQDLQHYMVHTDKQRDALIVMYEYLLYLTLCPKANDLPGELRCFRFPEFQIQ